jgi:2-methylcitrate dehydratase
LIAPLRDVDRARFEDLSENAREQLKIRVLDTIAVAIAALAAPLIVAIRELTAELDGRPQATLIGGAAFFNGALSR